MMRYLKAIKTLTLIKTLTKEKLIRNRFFVFKISCMLFVAFLMAGMFSYSAQAASGLRIYSYSTRKENTYTDKQIKVTLNGTTIGRVQTPGILINGIALIPYDDIFKKSDIAAECVYNKSEGTVSISKYGKTIVMTIGSKKATVNGKSVTLPIAPVKIKYVDVNLAKVLVPSRFIAETLGLGYTWNSSTSTVAIVKSTMPLSYNAGAKFEYTGVRGKVTINDKSIDLGNMPSIITNNTAMLRAKLVFGSSAIGATYQYNKTDKTVTLSKGNNTLVMTIGSTTAYLNGNATKLDQAPIIVKNYNVNTSYVMVPGSFTASCLGYDYTWNNTSKTSMITAQKSGTTLSNSSVSNTTPELGDDGIITEVGTILGQWSGNESLYGKGSGIHAINNGAATVDYPGIIYSISRDYSNLKKNAETFMIVGTGAFGQITAGNADKKITIQTTNMTCTDQTLQMYGITSNYVSTIGTYNIGNNSSSIVLDLLSSNYTYDLTLSEDKQILYVTVYYNAITSATIGTNSAGDYITLTGISPLSVTTNKSTGFVFIDLPNSANGLGDVYSNLAGSKFITLFYTISAPDKTQVVIGAKEGYEYYISEKGNQYTILFQTPGISGQPTGQPSGQPTGQPSEQPSEQPSTPVDNDTSKYEIIIPRPTGISQSMITDEDQYFKNRFIIKIPGDYTSTINSSTISNRANTVMDISVFLNSNNETEIIVKTSRLQGYAYTMDDTNIYIKVGEPRDIYKNIVILDAGHGGEANGAQYFGTKEKDINHMVLYTLGKKYFNQNTSQLKVYYTRITDVDMTLSNRAAFADKYDADLFVSLHMNASTSKSAYGTEVYYSNNNNASNRAGLNSKILADLFCNSITSNMGTYNRGSKSERYTVVHKNTVPAILIELGFLSNEKDYALISDPTFQDKAAKTIYETLLQVFHQYPTGR